MRPFPDEEIIKICKNAKKNEKIEIIGYSTGFNKIKYIFKRTFNLNDANASAITASVFVVSTTLALDNVFYQGDLTNKWCGGGQSYVTGEAQALTKAEMTSATGLLKKLNDYVNLSTDLVQWRSGENGYPELAIDY